MDYYDTNEIISYCLRSGVNISPADRLDWVFFSVALRVLGYPETTFAALSWQDQRTQRECPKVWENNRRYQMTQDDAKAKIVALAKAARVDVMQFRLSRNNINITSINADNNNPKITPRPNVIDIAPVSAGNAAPATPPPPRVFIDMKEVIAVADIVERSTLFRYLCGLFDPEEVRRVFRAYHVGATKDFGELPDLGTLASAFPYINAGGQCVDVHLQPYEADGHRWKPERHRYFQNWLLAKRKQNDRRAPWPLFGEHLLPARPAAPVGVVESEKTALICSIIAPRYVWVATGSLANLNARRCAAIRDRAVYVFPDVDGIEAWNAKAAALAKDGFRIFFCGQYIADNATPESKDDLADIIIKATRK